VRPQEAHASLSVERTRTRVDAIDLARGLIMVVMALDHTRDFFGMPGDVPTNLAQATPALFLTRWVTHFCAPVFFLLMGTGARLSLERRSRAWLSRFLVTRGLWLIVVEVTVLRCLSYQFNVDYHVTMLLVIWALGWSMIVLSGLLWLPAWAILSFGLLLVAGHDLFDGVASANPLWVVLHRPGLVVGLPGHVVFAAYPLVPWVGVTAVGYVLGNVYRWDAARRRALLMRVGLAAVAGFAVLRGIDRYGDPAPWASQGTVTMTVLSVLNTTKYPPSLAFLLMTLGPALLLLSATDGATARWLRPALVVGRVPMFYYVLHFTLIHALAVVVSYACLGTVHSMFESPDLEHYPFSPPPGWGFSLPVVYAVWAFVVVAMYGPCAWFAGLKARRKDAWLSYV
jgi:uncharacterized membrane protein